MRYLSRDPTRRCTKDVTASPFATVCHVYTLRFALRLVKSESKTQSVNMTHFRHP